MYSDGNLQVHIRDFNGRWLWSEDVRGKHNWFTEFSTYTGDERALSDADKQLLQQRQDNPPHEDEVIRCIVNEINNDMLYRVRNYFSHL